MLGNGFTSLGTLASKPCNLAVADLYNFLGYQPNFYGKVLVAELNALSAEQ